MSINRETPRAAADVSSRSHWDDPRAPSSMTHVPSNSMGSTSSARGMDGSRGDREPYRYGRIENVRAEDLEVVQMQPKRGFDAMYGNRDGSMQKRVQTSCECVREE